VYQMSSTALLHHLAQNILPGARMITRNLDHLFHAGNLQLQALHSPQFNGELAKQTLDLRIMYMVFFALTNNMVRLERLTDPENAFDDMLRNVINQFNRLTPRRLIDMLDSFPTAFSKSLEQGLFNAAIELGASRIVKVILERKFDPNKTTVVNGYHYTPLQRSCKHSWIEVTRCLLEHGADPNLRDSRSTAHYCLGSPHEGTLSSTTFELFGLLLRAGFEVSLSVDIVIRFKDPGLYLLLAENSSAPGLDALMGSDFLHTLLLDCENELATKILTTILEKSRGRKTKMHHEYERALLRASCAAVYRKNEDAFRRLLTAGAKPSSRCLKVAICTANMSAAQHLLNEEVSVTKLESQADFGKRPYTNAFRTEIGFIDEVVPIAEAIRTNSTGMFELLWQPKYTTELSQDYEAITQCIITACEAGNESVLDHVLPIWESYSATTTTIPGTTKTIPAATLSYYPIEARAMSSAIRHGHPHLVTRLLEVGFCPDELALHGALEAGHLSTAKILLEGISNLKASPPHKYPGTALHLAVLLDDLNLVQDMIFAGFCIDRMWAGRDLVEGHSIKQDCYPLMTTAILYGSEEAVNKLFEWGAPLDFDLESTCNGIISPLVAAVRTKRYSVLQDLIARGVNPCSDTALLDATSTRDHCAINILLDASIHWDLNYRRGFGARALFLAVKIQDLTMLSLLAGKADLNHQVERRGLADYDHKWVSLSAFGAAIASDFVSSISMVAIFIEHRVNVNTVVANRESSIDVFGNLTPLLLAINTKQLAKVQFLVEAGAMIDMPARLGIKDTPLQAAVAVGALDIINYLLDLGADPNEPPAIREGLTAIQRAASGGYMGIASLLLQRNANINAPGGLLLGRTAFEAAAENGRLEMLLFLIEHGADIVSDGGKQHKRAIMFAKANRHVSVVSLVESLYAEACKNAGVSIMSLLDDEMQF
jgi:ankyrin repeat protein